jgi:uncharacterized membrane protein (GlpM family)
MVLWLFPLDKATPLLRCCCYRSVMKLAVSTALSPYFIFYGKIYYISEVLEHSCSFSIHCDCLAQKMPASQLILRW